MSRRWWKCETKDRDRVDVLEGSPKRAACGAVESWLDGDEDDDGDWELSPFEVLVTPVKIDGTPEEEARVTRWRVKARKRISYSTEAEEVIE